MRNIFCSLVFLGIITKSAFSQEDDNRTIRVPVVFHVLYDDSSANISTDRIMAELKDLHDDFLLLNKDTSKVSPEFKKLIGNPNIEFYFADSIFQTGGEKGIIRIATSRNKKNMDLVSPPINPLRFLNVYTGRPKYHGGHPDGITSFFNDTLFHSGDGPRLNYEWVGLGYRLLTHETGHWAGLAHTFEKGCNVDGDEIGDTPSQKGETGLENCPEPGSTDLSCDSSRPYNYNNYMDYSKCRFMFTVEQASEMRKIIRELRPKIWRGTTD